MTPVATESSAAPHRFHSLVPSIPPPDGSTRTVLLADPDTASARLLREACEASGFGLTSCDDGAGALYLAGRTEPDAVVVSAHLAGLSAVEVIAALRRYSTIPIALGIGSGETQDAAAGLTAGASAVLSRPYQHREVQLLLNQVAGTLGRPPAEPVLTFGPFELNGAAYQVRVAGKPLELTVREFQLLRVLMQHSDRVVTSDQIRRDVWGGDAGHGNTIAVHVRRLRARLGADGDIVNVRGVGYRLALRGEPTRRHESRHESPTTNREGKPE